MQCNCAKSSRQQQFIGAIPVTFMETNLIYSGFLFDWCRPIHPIRISAIIQWIIITLLFNILICKSANFACQLILTMMDVT